MLRILTIHYCYIHQLLYPLNSPEQIQIVLTRMEEDCIILPLPICLKTTEPIGNGEQCSLFAISPKLQIWENIENLNDVIASRITEAGTQEMERIVTTKTKSGIAM